MTDSHLLQRQRHHFENVATTYADTRLADRNYNRFRELLWRHALKGLTELTAQPCSVLEAMCGLCDGLFILLDNGVAVNRYAAFDYSDTMVAKARELIARSSLPSHLNGESLHTFVADVCSHEMLSSYDLTILLGGLHHVYAHTQLALLKIASSLRKDGLFISFEPTHSNCLTRLVRKYIYTSNEFFDDSTESGYVLNDFNHLLANSGFVIERQLYPGLLLYCLFYNPDAFRSLPVLPGWLLRVLFLIEKRFYTSRFGRYWSFATITIARRAD